MSGIFVVREQQGMEKKYEILSIQHVRKICSIKYKKMIKIKYITFIHFIFYLMVTPFEFFFILFYQKQ